MERKEVGQNILVTKERITSIDALRAVTLFGILLVHVTGLYGWGDVDSGWFGHYIQSLVHVFLWNKCNTIFAMLFGVSFYLILRNPNYSTGKFVWRCFLLFLIGLFNKIFYTYDALMWYGLWGMVLAFFRRFSTKQLWLAFFAVLLIDFSLKVFVDLNQLLFGSSVQSYDRYLDAQNLSDVFKYPVWKAAIDYIRLMTLGPLGTLGRFLLGYCIAKSGVIENLQKYVTLKNTIIISALFALLMIGSQNFHLPIPQSIVNLLGSLCYSMIFLLLYYCFYPLFRFLEPYGKLGLTNYSFQSYIGVILPPILFFPLGMRYEMVLLISICFYVIQIIFSIMWLKKFKYGPYEWLWRCATNRKFSSNKK